MIGTSGPFRSGPNCFRKAAYRIEMTAACDKVPALSCIIPNLPAEKDSKAAPNILPTTTLIVRTNARPL